MNKAGNTKATPKDKMVNVIIVLVIIAFAAVGVYATYGKISEGMQDKAIADGEAEATVEYLARQANQTVEEYLGQYGLSLGDTIKKNTPESEMLDNMTIENYAKYNGQDAEEMINGTGLQDKVTKDTLWKDFLPQVPAVSVIGSEENFNQLKTQLGLGDDVTSDMPWGEFEKLMEEKQNELASATAESEAAATEAPAGEEAAQ